MVGCKEYRAGWRQIALVLEVDQQPRLLRALVQSLHRWVDVRELMCLGPGRLAEEFRRRAGLSSRDVKSCTRVLPDGYCSIPLPD